MATQATDNPHASPFMTWLLRSRLHALLSSQVMLITVTGKTTGRRYTLPVNYVRDGDHLIVSSRADRRWWRNLRGGAPVELRLRSDDLRGYADVIEGPDAVAAALRQTPALARSLHIKLGNHGQPNHPKQLGEFVAQRVLVRISKLALASTADHA
jgi:hypothetical protein